MKRQLRIGALFLLTASLFYGFAARAQGVVQQERVSYALSLIDAGADGTGTTQTGGPVTEASAYVRVKVTVSVPRTTDSAPKQIPAYASPARLMFRKHNGESTAFDGTLTLRKDAPTAGNYYPMPQAGADGLSIIDPTQLTLTAVDASEANLAFGQEHDPARWEATYVTEAFSVDDVKAAINNSNVTPSAKVRMVYSLLVGEATYEWFVASSRGVGSVARISDIQDHGRNMSFTDVRLWSPMNPNEVSNLDDDSKLSMGKYTSYFLTSMPHGNPSNFTNYTGYGWSIYQGAVGANWNGYTGVQLLNVDCANLDEAARIESPLYPDGVSSITFEACASAIDTGEKATLLVQYSVDGGAWLPAATDTAAVEKKTITLSAAFQKFTVDFGGELPEGSNARFRIVRNSKNADSGSANIFTYVLRNLLVCSAAPTATFSKLKVETTTPDCADPYVNENFRVGVEATRLSGTPRGYKADIRLRRRAEGDSSRAWYAITAETVEAQNANTPLMATLKPNVVLTNQDGSLNVRENAFFTDKDGALTGVLAGVYDVAVDCSVLGSFAAGRSEIDAREAVVQTLDGYDVEEENDAGKKVTVHRPYILNVREQVAKAKSVFLRVMYRTGTSAENYDLDTFDVELLASAQKANTWRIDLAKVLRMAESTAVYAWGYEPPKGSTETKKFETGYLSFKICAVDSTGKETWYGQRGSLSASTRPTEIKVVPAIVETFAKATTEEDTIPVVIAIDTLPNSHLMVELNLTNASEPTANLSGSYWQDFNTWEVSDSFIKTEFRENVTSATADFDCEVGENSLGDLTVVKGWIPDEGPLAENTAFKDELLVGRMSQQGQFPFIMPVMSTIAQNKFAQFGASSDEALPKALGAETSSAHSYSDYLEASATAEVVLRRSYYESGNIYRPEALFRLRGNGSTLSPRDDADASVKLNGVGKVSFRLGLSLPYDINTIAQILSKGDDLFACKGAGLSASVTLSNPSRTCAPSGYSVSYYLLDNMTGAFYELRVSQVINFPDTESEKPSDAVVMELYKWVGDSATRLSLTSDNGAYVLASAQLSGNTYGLWLRTDGRIAIGHGSGTIETLTEAARTADVQVTSNVATTTFNFALGSAECRPMFRYINSQATANDNYNNSRPINPDDVMVSTPSLLGRGTWDAKTDSTYAGRLQIERKTPQGNDVGKVKVVASGAGIQKEYEFYTVDMDKLCEVTLGVANATLTILPANRNCNVFIDDIAVSSWCGNDANRNGGEQVPLYTDEGFVANTGFAGVGVWIRPEADAQLGVTAADYNGQQCLLMQRSRQNYNNGTEYTDSEGIKHTGNAMALYLPYSNVGYGPVSFRYRIPQYDEYGNQGELPSVRVMLQFTEESSRRDYLGNNAIREYDWVNVSQPIELRNTNGAWAMVSVTPKLNNRELVGTEGTLRLVMVIPDDMKSSDDPYVYLDDVRVSDNREGTTASWSATNVRVSEAPVSTLYWKDRAATSGATPEEKTFAEKSTLTRAMQLNDTIADEETEGVYTTTLIESPLLEEGVGRVSFSARLMNAQAKPVRLYIYATTDITESMNGLQAVTYVDVPNTCYTTYDIDLSRCKNYLTPFKDGQLSDAGAGAPFSCQDIRRIVIKAFLEGDGVQNDPFNAPPSYGRVLVDQLAIANPVQPSIRVASVAFSNTPGESIPEEFDALSPRSQPVVNASMLRAMVHLDRAQLLKTETIRVFLTVDPHDALGTNGSSLMKYTDLYEYTDVLGGEVQAEADHPIYTWGQNVLSQWPLSSWFNRSAIEADIRAKLEQNNQLSTNALLEGLDIQANTIELTQSDKSQLYFYGDISKLVKVSENSLVRYNAWAVYQSEEGDMWHVAQITSESYTEFPWYFPRSLNAELREKASEEAEAAGREPMTADFFSPYFWVYSYLPGEAFINEINIDEQEDAEASSSARFVELCAPVNTSLAGWRIELTGDNAASSIISTINIAPETPVVQAPDVGVVPYQRKDATAAQRGFYTAFDKNAKVYYRDGSEKKTDFEPTANGGIAERNYRWEVLGSRSYAASARLHRPTGGAEHIVCFSLNRENNVSNTTSQRNLTNLYETYRSAYVTEGFGSEWFQTFSTSTWEDYVADTTTAPDAFGKLAMLKDKADPVQEQVNLHARRLVKADIFPADEDKDDRFSVTSEETAYVNDYATSDYANSIATVDMGGIFVTRKNAINVDVDHGPLDLTDLMIGPWSANVNPTVQTRLIEPTGGEKNLAPTVQVTPCQVNPDQYLVIYAGFASSTVKSELSGNYGSHTIDSYDEQGGYLRTNAAGRVTPQTWGLSQDVEKVKLSYKAFPFHKIESVSFRLRDASDVETVITDAQSLKDLLTLSAGAVDYSMAEANEGWITVDFTNVVTDVALTAKVVGVENGTTGEKIRYAVEAKASFALDPENVDARKVITSVSPYCGTGSAEFPMTGSAQIQPWWGNNFGFQVHYNDAALQGVAALDGVVITYPSPAANLPDIGMGLKSAWTGYAFETTDPNNAGAKLNLTLEGMEYNQAIVRLNDTFMPEAGTRYVTLGRGVEGVIADASVIPTLGDAYATTDAKEPAIPFCVWGIYTVTLQTDRGNEKVSFLMRQAMPGEVAEVANVWTLPTHYAPLADLNAGRANDEKIPYFYLYSTPPQSAWLSEVNLVKGADADEEPFAEVVFPVLRGGILNDKVAQAESTGWSVRRYDADGTLSWTGDCATATETNSGSTSYKYLTLAINRDEAARMAYVLHRPCGAAEGGAWLGADANGGALIALPATVAENAWLLALESFVVPGQSDATNEMGSVQLVGECVSRDGAWTISSDVAKRTEWSFLSTTKGTDNNGIRPDTKPVWNLVTVTSILKNNVYSGTPSGYQLVPGYFAIEDATGSSSMEVKTMGGSEWVYNGTTEGLVLSYRPRATYRFETITLPTELIDKVMLIGNEGALTPAEVATRVRELRAKPTEWVTLGGRAKKETHPVTGEPTGKIVFNVDFEERKDEKGNIITFGSLDSYVISLVFVGEPSSAQNTIEVAFGQGEVKLGAWMVTQTLFGLNADGTPNPEKGGDAVTAPIWSDENGSITLDDAGEVIIDDETGLPVRKYANVHGWAYQPIVGDTLGMAAVINPDLGLQGGSLTNPVAMLTKENASLRPFLVWTAIPKSKIPDNLFNASLPVSAGIPRGDFIRGWGLNAWIGSPSVLDGATISLTTLRQNLRAGAASTASSAMYTAAGIIPMTYQGYCDEDEKISNAPATEDSTAMRNLLSFRTMTTKELEDALALGETTGLTTTGTLETDTNPLLPFTTSIDLSNPEIWQDGAILRFAVIIADAVKGTVYDCQSISNFSSKDLDVYCPWYVPDVTTNVNRATSATDAGGGVSPFAWVYSIPQGGVWINEIRPFAITTSAGDRVASAFELAMYASPLQEDVSDPMNQPSTFTPTRTLDGWKVITRYAPLPLIGADPTLPNDWVTHKEVPLHSWVPRRRVMKSLATSMGDNNLYLNADYSLDYYTALAITNPANTAVVKASLSIDEDAYNAAYYKDLAENVDPVHFQWLNFNLTNAARRDDEDLFNADLQQKLTEDSEGPYANGVIYSIALVRNNGVIEDSVMFYKESPYGGFDSIGSYLEERLDIAIKREEVNRASAGAIRALTTTPLPNTSYPQLPAQFLRFTNALGTELGWYIAYSQNRVNSTFSMPNEMEVEFEGLSYTQPYLVYEPNITSFAAIEVHVTGGGGATLSLNANGQTETGRDLAVSALKATGYELSLQNWNQAWYAPPTITRDSKPFTPAAGYAVITTYASNGTRASSVRIDSGLVSEDTLYNIVFNYTAEAQALKLPTEMTPEFMKWLQQVAPAEVVETPGVDLDETYWLGVESPADGAVDPKLAINNIGMYFDDVAATEAKPTISVKLTNKGTLVTSLKEGGNVVLLGKQTLEGDWIYLQTLGAEELAEDAEIILSTDCKFFRAVLLSDAEVQELR